MNRNISEKGQALILIAFGIVALIGFTALAIDGGRVFSDRRNAQNAADTAALAAALDEIYARYGKDTLGYEQTGLKRAADNYYQNDADHTVTVEFCDDARTAGDPCTGLPSGAVESEYIRVKIESKVHMTFARVLGREFVINHVEAVSRVQGALTTGVFNSGAGMYSTKMSGDDCYKVLGNADLKFHGTGIFVNCDGSDALALGGSYGLYMEANAEVVGCSNDKNDVPPPIQGTGTITCGATQQPISKNTFKDVPTAPSPPSCGTDEGHYISATHSMEPGYFDSNVSLSSDTTFPPGTYCFINGAQLRLIGGSSITGTGTVRMVMSDDLSLKGTANDFEDLELYMNDANFEITTDGVLNADRMRFYGFGDSSFTVGAQGHLTSGDLYIYSEEGMIDFQAGAVLDITAPPQGDTYGGILMYIPWDNPHNSNPNDGFLLNGGSTSVWRGTILMPNTTVTYNGSAGFELIGQVIAKDFKINGGAAGDIYYNSDFVYSPPNDPTIEFTK
jgi:Flp pilus assembly protein TadG